MLDAELPKKKRGPTILVFIIIIILISTTLTRFVWNARQWVQFLIAGFSIAWGIRLFFIFRSAAPNSFDVWYYFVFNRPGTNEPWFNYAAARFPV